MSDIVVKQPSKSILKQVHTQPVNSASSWFTTQQPRINSLFGSLRKNTYPQQEQQTQVYISDEINMLSAELTSREIRRVRFPAIDITSEYVFAKEALITEHKNHLAMEPMNIQTCSQLLSLYELVCRKKQEPTIDSLVSTLITQPHAAFLTRVDLTDQPIDRHNMSPLADIMYVDFGIRELVLDNCRLDDDAVKIIMSSLLENDKIKHLSLANNPQLTSLAFKYIAIYVKGSSQLASLDLSFTQPDKKSIQYLTTATLKCDASVFIPSLSSLLLNGCDLRAPQLEALAITIRKSSTSLQHLSIRGNRIGTKGALAIGVMLRDYDTGFIQKGIERLFLDNNDLSQGGIQYIAQALRRNQSLRYLSMRECKIDAKDCILLGEALKYNHRLERFDIGYNPLMTLNMDGITSIRQALNVNRSLKDLCLADTGLSTEAGIALAECLPENNTLVRLDLSRNPNILIAGLLALSVSIKMNDTLTFIDINISKEDKDMVEIHNGILAACTKNAQSRKSKVVAQETSDSLMVTAAQATARLTLEQRLAAVTKGKSKRGTSASSFEAAFSQPPTLPKRRPENKDSLLIQQAFDDVAALEDLLSGRQEENDTLDTLAVAHRCRQEHSKICSRICEISNPSHLELLLAINDRLTVAIQSFEEKHAKEADTIQAVLKEQKLQQPLQPEQQQEDARKEGEKLSNSFEIGDDDDDDDEEDEILVDDEDAEANETPLQALRNEIEAEESAAFLNAKKDELESNITKEEIESDGLRSDTKNGGSECS